MVNIEKKREKMEKKAQKKCSREMKFQAAVCEQMED